MTLIQRPESLLGRVMVLCKYHFLIRSPGEDLQGSQKEHGEKARDNQICLLGGKDI